jgi:nicotinate-nucleotide--dimethylbenzimidazole phosphoribosyltransferase
MRMKNLVLAILVASLAILGFYAYQSSQQVATLQTEITAKEAALTTIEGEKAALATQVETLQDQVDQLTAAAEAAANAAPATEIPAEAPATEAPATEAPATQAPVTEPPATEAPATEEPTTEAPATTP